MKTSPIKTQIKKLSGVVLLALTSASASAQAPAPDGMALIPAGP